MSEDVTKTANVAVSKEAPKGFEGAEEEDLVQPRVKIAQDMSPIVKNKVCDAGMLYNSITDDVYGKDVMIQPVLYFKTRIYWAPRDEGGDIICRAVDGKTGGEYKACVDCEFRRWGKNKDGEALPPPCTEIHNFLSIVRDNSEEKINSQIVAVSFMKTTFKEGRHLLSKMRYAGGDMFSKKYKIYTKPTKNQLGEFWIMGSDAGIAVSNEEYKEGLAAYGSMAGKKVEVDMREDEVSTPSDLTDADKAKGEEEDELGF